MKLLTETARIVAIDEKQSMAWVDGISSSPCGSCSMAKSGCGSGLNLLSKFSLQPKPLAVVIPQCDQHQYAVGDMVSIVVANTVLSRYAVIFYVLPLILMLVLSCFAHTTMRMEWFTIAMGLSGFGLGVIVLRCFSPKFAIEGDYLPRIAKPV